MDSTKSRPTLTLIFPIKATAQPLNTLGERCMD